MRYRLQLVMVLVLGLIGVYAVARAADVQPNGWPHPTPSATSTTSPTPTESPSPTAWRAVPRDPTR